MTRPHAARCHYPHACQTALTQQTAAAACQQQRQRRRRQGRTPSSSGTISSSSSIWQSSMQTPTHQWVTSAPGGRHHLMWPLFAAPHQQLQAARKCHCQQQQQLQAASGRLMQRLGLRPQSNRALPHRCCWFMHIKRTSLQRQCQPHQHALVAAATAVPASQQA